jgi:hypothetical protein
MKQNTSFIKFNEKNSTVELTLSFNVTEAQDTLFIPKHELTMHSFSEVVIDALEQRMKHCKDILTTEILPAKDKVFTPYMVFSNEVGKHFSIEAYNAMEEAKDIIKSFNFSGNEDALRACLSQLEPLQAQQCLKAVATMQTNIREELLREIVDALSEAFLCNRVREREEIRPQDVGNVEDPFKAY